MKELTKAHWSLLYSAKKNELKALVSLFEKQGYEKVSLTQVLAGRKKFIVKARNAATGNREVIDLREVESWQYSKDICGLEIVEIVYKEGGRIKVYNLKSKSLKKAHDKFRSKFNNANTVGGDNDCCYLKN